MQRATTGEFSKIEEPLAGEGLKIFSASTCGRF
jgi:hypothetical protein